MSESKLYFISIILYLYILLTVADNNENNNNVAVAKAYARVCGDIHVTVFELKTGFKNDQLLLCEISLGSVTYAPMNSVKNASTTTSISFPYLREIYGYMLLGYSSLDSFSSMFPNLSVIHGRDLHQGYSLIITNNFLLHELGLKSLMSIRRGNVIIARNAQLCYGKSLRWNDLLETKQNHIILRQNRDNCAFCPTCPSACWSPTQCQKTCSANCQGNCVSEKVCCHEQCVGGCYYHNRNMSSTLICNACRNMRIYATGICVQKCPTNMLKTRNSLCVTPAECKSLVSGTGFILEGANECVLSCPSGFIREPDSRCVRCISSADNSYCNGTCRDKHIQSIEDFKLLKYCSRVYTLTIYNIQTVESKGTSFQEAFAALESLEQIDLEFTIRNVKIFSTLNIFPRLRRIGTTSNSSTTIEENEFLTELWPSTQQRPTIQGNFNIVRNARLCIEHITDFINYTTKREPDLQVTSDTLNQYANGYLTSCESNFLEITINNISSLTARVNIAISKDLFLHSSGKVKNIRRSFFSVFYKLTRTKNETYFDATHSLNWLRKVEMVNYNRPPNSESFKMSTQLESLVGYEWYAVYASITSNLDTIGSFSAITYFQTLQRQPEPVLNLHGKSLSRSTIELVWQTPSKPNGPITNYLVYYAPIEDRLPVDNSRLLCLMKDRWRSEVNVQVNNLNLTHSIQCSQSKTEVDNVITNKYDYDDEESANIDRVATDLSIIEYKLINSVTQRSDPLSLSKEVQDDIINNLDIYFENNTADFNDNYRIDAQEPSVVEHRPYIDQYNRSTSDTRIIIDDLKEAQMYLFQVYACHNISKQALSESCSLNGIILAVRTKPGDASRDLVRNVQLTASANDSDHLTAGEKLFLYRISWLEPLEPNGLVYYYMIYIAQNSNNESIQEYCVDYDKYSISVILLPSTTYRLRIITYTIARLNNEYDDRERISDEPSPFNSTNFIFELTFTTKGLSSNQLIRQNRLPIFILIILLTIILLFVIVGALIYYYKSRRRTKTSRPAFRCLLTTVYDDVNDRTQSYSLQHTMV
ncbi:unnamed protein product [Rotaria magnacalcarata]|uniref:Fibronectin type-III domain-containing protein n=2 Tax=Rotaria magnacalcarata TaxID=392030 RepID=A0A816GLN5_9BILA|nr:unnamed protein product [Rotaria magnacalcarata]